jgi:hypothetical protein
VPTGVSIASMRVTGESGCTPAWSGTAYAVTHVGLKSSSSPLDPGFTLVSMADCCDGTDEADGVCANTCQEVGNQDREARLRIADTHLEATLSRHHTGTTNGCE